MALPHRDPQSDDACDVDPTLPSTHSRVESSVADGGGAGAVDLSTQPVEVSGASDGTHRGLHRSRLIGAAAVAVLTLGIGAGSAVAVNVQQNAREAAAATEAARIADAQAAARIELEEHQAANRAARAEADRQRVLAERAAAVTAGVAVLDGARNVLAASPQAAPELRTALQTAVDTAAPVLAATPAPAVVASQQAVAPIAAPQQAVVDSQAAWQAAEDARLAAEAAAAAEAKAAAERAAAEARAARPASRSAAESAAPSGGRAPAPAPGGGAATPAPAPEPAASSVPEFSAGALGESINAYRAGNGLPPLSISRSGSLVAHAAAMAQAGSIWHSGGDNIVGYTMPGTASRLVSAWAASPAHNAQMLRTDVTSMQVGGALLDNRLYGAVKFS
jgi:uncharacterized protein YkwD